MLISEQIFEMEIINLISVIAFTPFFLMLSALSSEDAYSITGEDVKEGILSMERTIPTVTDSGVNSDCQEQKLHDFHCNGKNRDDPSFSAVNCTSIMCKSLHPIIWDISFTPPLWVEDADSIPYQIKTERLSCYNSETENMCLTHGYYFESILIFNATNLRNRTTSVAITCRGIRNVPVLKTWYVNVSQNLNISSGKSIRQTDSIRNKTETTPLTSKLDNGGGKSKETRISELCPNLTVEYDKRSGIHTCFIRNETHPFVNVSVLTHLHCQDWSHCPWLISQTSEKICQGTSFSTAHLNKAGLFYCRPSADQIVYWRTIKIPEGGNESKYAIIDDQPDTLNRLIMFNDTTRNETILLRRSNTRENDDADITLKCSAPKFLAFKWFKWEVYYSYAKETRLAGKECSCRGTTEDQENYMEIITCKHPSKYTAMKIIFNCTVYLQSGKTFFKTIEYVRGNFTSAGAAVHPPGDKGDRSNLVVIVGVSLSAVVIILIAVVVCVIRQNSVGKTFTLTKEEVENFYFGYRNHEVLLDGNVQAESLAFREDQKIWIQNLEIQNTVLNSGQFGIVHHGNYQNQEVAIKSCKAIADRQYFKAFLKEIKIMAGIGEHENIVRFIGPVVDDVAKGKCLAVLEFSPFGNLKNYLRKYSAQHSDESRNAYVILGDELEHQSTLQLNVLAYFCKQIAQGMEYLVQKNVIHGDLASRNVLVFKNYVVKITDFGLSRNLYTYSAYTKKSKVPLPWAWMALESLRFMTFSSETDVWSFGVTMWEIFSMGQTPYAGTAWTTRFVDLLEAGQRLTKPTLAPDLVRHIIMTPRSFSLCGLNICYNFMLTCWENNPQSRPTFAECAEFFSSLEPSHDQTEDSQQK